MNTRIVDIPVQLLSDFGCRRLHVLRQLLARRVSVFSTTLLNSAIPEDTPPGVVGPVLPASTV